MAVNKKNLRYCEVQHTDSSTGAIKTYDIMIAVDNLDQVNNILQEWALDKLGETLSLPEELITNKDITEILTSLDIDNFVYLQSPVSIFKDVPKFAGLSGSFPILPKILVGGLYVLPETTAYLYSEIDYGGHFGEYSVSTTSLALSSDVNFIGIDYNSGIPIWQNYTSESSFNYSSIIPVAAVLYLQGGISVIPMGQTGDALPEKLLEVQNKRKKFDIMSLYTLATSNRYVELSALTVSNGTTDIDCLSLDTETVDNDMYLHYRDAGSVWQTTKITQVDNVQYQSSSGLAALGAGEFVINNIYRVIDDTKLLLFVKLSDVFTDLDSAVKSLEEQDVPDEIDKSSVLVGRIIIEQGSSTPVIQQVQRNSFGVI